MEHIRSGNTMSEYPEELLHRQEVVLIPMEDILNPAEDILNPMEDILNPAEDILNPTEDILNPMEDILNPMEEVPCKKRKIESADSLYMRIQIPWAPGFWDLYNQFNHF